MKRKDRAYANLERQVTGNLDPLENELQEFIKLIQSSMEFFDLRFLKVVKRNGKAYFEYMSVVKEFPLEYIEQAKQARNGS